jgi:hypothetical protein
VQLILVSEFFDRQARELLLTRSLFDSRNRREIP